MKVSDNSLTVTVRWVGIILLIWNQLIRWTSAVEHQQLDIEIDEIIGQSPHFCSVRRHAANRGFHRDLITHIHIKPAINHNGASENQIVVVENIPSGMYVDMHQLAAKEKFGGPKVFSTVAFDVEKPEFLSSPHQLFVFGKLQNEENKLKSNIVLPVHLRYHRPSSTEDYTNVQISGPQILIKEVDNSLNFETTMAPCDSTGISQCVWNVLECHFVHGEQVVFSVPVGRTQHQMFVMVSTILVSIAATALLGNTILNKNSASVKKD